MSEGAGGADAGEIVLLTNGVRINLKTGDWFSDLGVPAQSCGLLVEMTGIVAFEDLPAVCGTNRAGEIVAVLFSTRTMQASPIVISRVCVGIPATERVLAAVENHIVVLCKCGRVMCVSYLTLSHFCFAQVTKGPIAHVTGCFSTGGDDRAATFVLVASGMKGIVYPNLFLCSDWATHFEPVPFAGPEPAEAIGLVVATYTQEDMCHRLTILSVSERKQVTHSSEVTRPLGTARPGAPIVFAASPAGGTPLPEAGQLHMLAADKFRQLQMADETFPWLLTRSGILVILTDVGPMRTKRGRVVAMNARAGLLAVANAATGKITLIQNI